MVTRVLELIARPGASAALCGAIDDDVRVLLSDADGFLELVTLISEGEARLVVVLTVWRGRTAAAEYEKDVYPIIVELLQPFLESPPLERSFQFAHAGRSMPHSFISHGDHSPA
jgi:hypothetical protein